MNKTVWRTATLEVDLLCADARVAIDELVDLQRSAQQAWRRRGLAGAVGSTQHDDVRRAARPSAGNFSLASLRRGSTHRAPLDLVGAGPLADSRRAKSQG